MHEFVAALAALDKPLYCICEQDCYPAPSLDFLKPNAVSMRKYLADCGLGIE
jgi:inosose dehydratase